MLVLLVQMPQGYEPYAICADRLTKEYARKYGFVAAEQYDAFVKVCMDRSPLSLDDLECKELDGNCHDGKDK